PSVCQRDARTDHGAGYKDISHFRQTRAPGKARRVFGNPCRQRTSRFLGSARPVFGKGEGQGPDRVGIKKSPESPFPRKTGNRTGAKVARDPGRTDPPKDSRL